MRHSFPAPSPACPCRALVPSRRACRAVLPFVVALAWPALSTAQPLPGEPPAGDWISVPYADALMQRRSAVAAADASPPLVLRSTRTRNAFHLDVTNFHETRRLRVVASQAPSAPGGDTRLVLASADGQPSPADPRETVLMRRVEDRGVHELRTTLAMEGDAPQRYRPLPVPVDEWASRVLLAGDYSDAQGRTWTFGDDMQANTPDGAFAYRVALDPSEAGCDYFQTPDRAARGGQRRTGFAWKGHALELFRIVYDSEGPPIACAPTPFAVLSRTAPSATAASPTTCALTRLPITPTRAGAWEHLESRTASFTLAHWNAGAAPNPTQFNERGIVVTHADGRTCQFDPTIYGRDLWVSRDERTLAVVSSSGSGAALLLVDVATCAVRARLDVSGAPVVVDNDLVSHPGDCEMSEATRATCRPASMWRLDVACAPRRLDDASMAWTRERFGVAFWAPSEIDAPMTSKATWLGTTPPTVR